MEFFEPTQETLNYVSRVQQGLLHLYDDPNHENRNTAQAWLHQVTKLDEAWRFSWLLLQEGQSDKAQFFGANALLDRIRRGWHTVPEESIEPLRMRIFSALLASGRFPGYVRRKLCDVLASYAMQAVPIHWTDFVANVLATLEGAGAQYNVDVRGLMLEFVSALPPQLDVVGREAPQSRAMAGELGRAVPIVIRLVEHFLEPTQPIPLRLLALKCVVSWVDFGIPISAAGTILTLALNALAVEELFEEAAGTITALATSAGSTKYPQTIRQVLTALVPVCVREASSEDGDNALPAANMMAEVSTHHMRWLMSSAADVPLVVGVCEAMVAFLRTPGKFPVDEEASESALQLFWQDVQDGLDEQRRIDLASKGTRAFADDIVRALSPVMAATVDAMVTKATYPDDAEFASWAKEDRGAFRTYRGSVREAILYVQGIMGDACLNRLADVFLAAYAQRSPWQHVEAPLFLIAGLGEIVVRGDAARLPDVFAALQTLPQHNLVLSAGLRTVGEYACWLARRPEHLDPAIRLVLSCFPSPNLATGAADALRKLCEACAIRLAPHAPAFIAAVAQATANSVLQPKAVRSLLEGTGKIVSALTLTEATQHLSALAAPCLQTLATLTQTLATSPGSALNPACLDEAMRAFDQLEILCLSVDPDVYLVPVGTDTPELEALREELVQRRAGETCPHPVVTLMDSNWDTFAQAMYAWRATAACFAATKVIGIVLRTTHAGSLPLVERIANLLLLCFDSPRQCIVEAAASVAGMHGTSAAAAPVLVGLAKGLATRCLSSLTADNLRDQSDVINPLFTLLSRLLRHCPLVVVEAGVLHDAITCALAVSNVPEPQSVKIAATFLATVVKCAKDPREPTAEFATAQGWALHAAAKNVAATFSRVPMERGQEIVTAVIQAIAGASPAQVVGELGEVLYAIREFGAGHLASWLSACLKVDGFPVPHLTAARKAFFVDEMTKASQKHKFKTLVESFSKECRQ